MNAAQFNSLGHNLRGALLFGVSISALTAPAFAANPLSPGWISAHANASQASTGAVTGSLTSGTNAAALSQTVQNMEKAAAALQAADDSQAALRSAAAASASSSVPNGLEDGGLVVGSGTWSDADAPVQTTSSTGRTEVTITQTAQTAILNWSSFNVGAKTDLIFDQSAGGSSENSWVALNRVTDTSLNPAQILGTISAQGQVYIIDANGIIFGGNSQINVGALLASTADFYSTTGLTSDQDFATNGIYSTSSSAGLNPAFQNAPVGAAITVEGGAEISTNAALSSVSSGGFVIMLADQVSNQGTILTPAGQTALAAGADFYLIPGYSPSGGGDAFSTTLGSEISIGNDGLTHVASNSGVIEATDGDVTMVGQTVDQDGVAFASTSVSQRGTIHLLTPSGDSGDDVTLGADSLTYIAPDLDDTTTALDSQRAALIAESATLNGERSDITTDHQYLNDAANLADLLDESRVEITAGGSVEFTGGSITMAQAGQIAVSAGVRDQADRGAILDVSGVPDVLLAATENQLAVTIETTQLRDSTINADASYLKGDEVYVDLNDLIYVASSSTDSSARYYTEGGLLEVSGDIGDLGHTIGEWSASAGSITLAAPQVVAQSGSQFNLSGGSLDYQAGYVKQSELVGVNGQTYDVDQASANLLYTGLFGDFTVSNAKWDTSTTYASPLIGASEVYESAYTVGRDAGTLTLSTPTVLFNGTIVAATVTGAGQTTAHQSSITDAFLQPQNAVAQGGQLLIGDYTAAGLNAVYDTNVTIGSALSDADQVGITNEIATADDNTAVLSAALLSNADLGAISIATDGSVTVSSALALANGGSLTLIAPAIEVGANVTAHAGSVKLTDELNATDYLLPGSGDPSVSVDAGVTIDLSGLWTNLALAPLSGGDLAYKNGGNLDIDSAGGLSLGQGSVVDLDAGGGLSAKNALITATGGSLSLIANDLAGGLDGSDALVLDGTISAYGTGTGGGGALVLRAPSVAIGETAAAGGVTLDPAFFQSGFGSYTVDGVNGLSVAANTDVAVLSPVYELNSSSAAGVTGSTAASVLTLATPALFDTNPAKATLTQRAGASVTLEAENDPTGVQLGGGALSIGQGAVIGVDPGQSIGLGAYDSIDIEGTLSAPGGAISVINNRIQNGISQTSSNYQDGLAIWVGATADLDVSGVALTATDAAGRSYGKVYAGGTISLGGISTGATTNTDAQVIIRPGAVLDASGTSATIDQDAGWSVDSSDPVLDASNGGTISLSSFTGIYNDGTLLADAGGAGASGGTLAIALETPTFETDVTPLDVPADQLVAREMIITATGGSGLASDLTLGEATPDDLFGQAVVGTDQIAAGGFASLSLSARGLILFNGDVTLSAARSITLSNGFISDSSSSGSVSLDAPVVTLNGVTQDIPGSGTHGGAVITNDWGAANAVDSGSFTVNADQIYLAKDLRFGTDSTITLSDGSTTSVNADDFANLVFNSSGAITFLSGSGTSDGATTLWTEGNVALAASEIYPATGVTAEVLAGFNFDDSSANALATGSITISRTTSATPQAPYSVGGSLALIAGTIYQGGVLEAPYGTITLGASGEANNITRGAETNNATSNLVELLPGSITSVSLDGLDIPYGGTADTVTYDYDGTTVALGAPSITLAGSSINGEAGALLNLSGGGTLSGGTGELLNGTTLESQGFVSGKGGSTDTLVTPLASFSGGSISSPSLATNPVYAIVKDYSGNYAPVTPLDSSSNYYGSLPLVGEKITIPAGVPGLPAGTYTLLPSYYALLPGGYRVELATTAGLSEQAASGTVQLANGTYLTAGTTSIAGTSIAANLDTEMLITPAATVEKYSQYDTEDYATFAVANAASTGTLRPLLPGDAGTLDLNLSANDSAAAPLTFAGTADFAAAGSGYDGGTLSVTAQGESYATLDIGASSQATAGNTITVDASQLDAFDAPRLMIGGTLNYDASNSATPFSIVNIVATVNVLDGADLTAADILLSASAASGLGAINVDSGAVLDTLGQGSSPFATVDGTVGYNTRDTTLLALSNGSFTVSNNSTSDNQGPISIASGATLLSDGSITLSTDAASSIGTGVALGASALNLVVGTATLSAAPITESQNALPGIDLTQSLMDQLLAGDPASGAPALTTLTITATGSVNFIGSVDLSTVNSTTGQSSLSTLVINSPAIYGEGSATDVAELSTDTLVWNGIAVTSGTDSATSQIPTGVLKGGAGSGQGTLELIANNIILGDASGSAMLDDPTLARVTDGFSTVDLIAADEIETNNSSTLTVNGALNLESPLITAAAGADNTITATGALGLSNPTSATASSSQTGNLGGTLALTGASIDDATTIATEAGKLSLTATNDLDLESSAVIDAAGPTSSVLSADVDNAGGTVTLTSDKGAVNTDAGSVIDVASSAAAAGSVTISAVKGAVDLGGTLEGTGTAKGNGGGSFTLAADNVADFDALQGVVQAGGFDGLQSYTLNSGDLTLDQTITAKTIDVTLNGGALDVATTLNASGTTVGAITLAATGDLTIEGNALLDAHGTVEQDDSYGNRIDSENIAQISLTTTKGTLTLGDGATLNVSAATDSALPALGEVSLFAPQIDDYSSIAVNAAVTVNIEGAASIALYGSRSFKKSTIDQKLIDKIATLDTAFVNAALANSDLTAATAGLAAYGADFQIRPAVDIVNKGDITVEGDIDLENLRTAARGGSDVAQAGYLNIRAGGNLNIYGSITDGFTTPVDGTGGGRNPDDNGWVLYAGTEAYNQNVVVPAAVTLKQGTTFPADSDVALSFPITIGGGFNPAVLKADVVIPQDIVINGRYVVPAGGMVATANITSSDGTVYHKGELIKAGTVFKSGTEFDAGSVLPWQVNLASGTVWNAGSSLGLFVSDVTLMKTATLQAGDMIPAGSDVVLARYASSVDLRPEVHGKQGEIWAVSDMLPAGSQSWSIGLTSGANITSANRAAVQTTAQLAAAHTSGNMVLADTHYSYASSGGTPTPGFSVIRTGTGSLGLTAGGSIDEESLYGIYTAGTQSADVSSADELARGDAQDGSNKVLGRDASAGIYNLIASDQADGGAYEAWYPTGGGNVSVAAQGNISGDVLDDSDTFATDTYYSDAVGNWLWRQGDGSGTSSAWWINFGTYARSTNAQTGTAGTDGSVFLTGFTGIGALGGGNVTVTAGGDAGNISPVSTGSITDSGGLVVAVGSTGRVTSVAGTDSGTIEETGGGDLSIDVGGAIDPVFAGNQTGKRDSLGNLVYGTITDLRGAVTIDAGSIGDVIDTGDRVEDGVAIATDDIFGGFTVALGDASLAISTRGDLVLGDVEDPGRVVQQNTTAYTDASGDSYDGGESAYFSLWQAATSVDLLSEGGDVTPVQANPGSGGDNLVYPSTLLATAASGDIIYGTQELSGGLPAALELAPSATGQLALLAEGSISADYNTSNLVSALDIAMSGAATDDLTNPFNPADLDVSFTKLGHRIATVSTATDVYAADSINAQGAASLFAFEADTPTGDLHANDSTDALIYAATGNITDLDVGEIIDFATHQSVADTVATWYIAAKPFDIEAGEDIVNAGSANLLPASENDVPNGYYSYITDNLLLNNKTSDLSLVSAGGDMTDVNFAVAGPGTLEISAGGNIYQGASGSLQSLGGIYDISAATRTGGANILVEAGMGSQGADWSDFAAAYLDPDNLYNDAYPLSSSENKGKVAATYDTQLIAWLKSTYGYSAASVTDALTYFDALPSRNQTLFLSQIYFTELAASGAEYADPSSLRYKSYIRGKDAIATLFTADSYAGNITMFGDSGITTDRGGAIDVLTPGGGLVLGLANTPPPTPAYGQPPAGLITFGSGDVNVYSLGTIYLGQSRIFTTFGGNITLWAATGNIAAGAGSNTTQVYQVPSINYDNYGDITLSPSVPTTGAGIATLAPIAGTTPGDVTLVAPEGIVDAGDAGIRSSGNVVIAAAAVANASNIKSSGSTSGVSTVAAPNVGALASASSASAGASASTATTDNGNNNQREAPSIISVDVISYGDDDDANQKKKRRVNS